MSTTLDNAPGKLFNPKVLSWAMTRSGLAIDCLSKRIGVKSEKIQSWETGVAEPTLPQAEKLAQMAHVPFPMLLLETVPEISCELPDFRTPGSTPLTNPSPELEDTIQHARVCQGWYREYLEELGEERNSFAGCLADVDDFDLAVNVIRQHIDIENARKQSRNKEAFVTNLSRLIEQQLGVCVMRSGTAPLSNKRPLNPSEFRGFSLCDNLAPLIFINTKDPWSGQVFSLIHELVHIARGVSGVSGDVPESHGSSEETFANRVAGKLLIPDEAIVSLRDCDAVLGLLKKAEAIAKKLRVSSWAVLTRARSAELIATAVYEDAIERIKESLKYVKKNQDNSGGPDYYMTRLTALGRNLSDAMITSVQSGNLMFTDMKKMSGIKPANIERYAKTLGPWRRGV